MKKINLIFGHVTTGEFSGKSAWIGVTKVDHETGICDFTVEFFDGTPRMQWSGLAGYMAKHCGVQEIEITYKAEAYK